MNDINNIIIEPDVPFISYADDNLLLTDTNLPDVIENGIDLINETKPFFQDNRLMVKEEKTDYIIFKGNNNIETPTSISFNTQKMLYNKSVSCLY